MNGYGLNHALIRVTGGLWLAVPVVRAIRNKRRKKRTLKLIQNHFVQGVQYHDSRSAQALDANR